MTFHPTLKIVFKLVWNLDLKRKVQKSVHILKWKSAGLSPQFTYTITKHISFGTSFVWLTIHFFFLILNFAVTECNLSDDISLLRYYIKLSVLSYLIFLSGFYPSFCTLCVSVYHSILTGKMFENNHNLENGNYHFYFSFKKFQSQGFTVQNKNRYPNKFVFCS